MDKLIEETKQNQDEPHPPRPVQKQLKVKTHPKKTNDEKLWGSVHLKKHQILEEQKLLRKLPGETLTEYDARFKLWAIEQIHNLQKGLQG